METPTESASTEIETKSVIYLSETSFQSLMCQDFEAGTSYAFVRPGVVMEIRSSGKPTKRKTKLWEMDPWVIDAMEYDA